MHTMNCITQIVSAAREIGQAPNSSEKGELPSGPGDQGTLRSPYMEK